MTKSSFTLGLDFGTESVRAIVVDRRTGRIAAAVGRAYARGVIDEALPGGGAKLPHDYALQHPQDWLDQAGEAARAALADAGVAAEQVIGVGVDFTSCTMLPAKADGTPLCLLPEFANVPLAWPKLWKHHAAKSATDRFNRLASERNESWLPRYGGVIGLEWFFPKILETLDEAPHVYAAADVWIEAGDWFVWQLTSGPFPDCSTEGVARSTCQAGYKACWNAETGYPSPAFFAALNPAMADVVAAKMPGALRAPGARAGVLTGRAAALLGLRAGTPVATAVIDAHAGVAGAGVTGAGTMVLVMGTSSCHMLNGTTEATVPGVAGVVRDGILPGFFGYETGQASVGDAFAWLVETFNLSHAKLNEEARTLPPGSGGVLAIDWLNGCRTPRMDGRLSGMFLGLTLGTRPAQMYRALMEATAFGVRWIVDTIANEGEGGGVPVGHFVASGGLPAKSPLLMQIYADVLGKPIRVAASDQSCALGAAILGATAAEEASDPAAVAAIIAAMAPQAGATTYTPQPNAVAAYADLYAAYRSLTRAGGDVDAAMKLLASRRGTAMPAADAARGALSR